VSDQSEDRDKSRAAAEKCWTCGGDGNSTCCCGTGLHSEEVQYLREKALEAEAAEAGKREAEERAVQCISDCEMSQHALHKAEAEIARLGDERGMICYWLSPTPEEGPVKAAKRFREGWQTAEAQLSDARTEVAQLKARFERLREHIKARHRCENFDDFEDPDYGF
jgi:hypothetical protein